jgi:hypothetical protein
MGGIVSTKEVDSQGKMLDLGLRRQRAVELLHRESDWAGDAERPSGQIGQAKPDRKHDGLRLPHSGLCLAD